MKHRWLTLALAAAAFCLLFFADTALAEPSDGDYFTLSNQERYTILHEVKLNNLGREAAHNVNLSIPLMDKDTPAYSRKLREQLEPWPDRIETDEYGRRMAYYHLDELPAGAELVFQQKYVVDNASIRYDNSIINDSSGYEKQMESYYLLPSPGIESDNEEIIAFAREVAKGYTNPYDIARNAFSAVNQYMSYVEDDLVYGGALRALRRAQGVCEDYSSLYVAVLRALGIAARQQGGYLYLPGEHTGPPYADEDNGRINLNQMRHTWVEFYIPGQGWVIADPTFTYTVELGGVPTKLPIWRYFASISSERRYLFFREGSFNEEERKGRMTATGGYVEIVGEFINGYLLPGSQAAYYNDLAGHWAEQAVMRLSEREEPLLQGMGNGMFGVNELMTRAQLVACLQRLLKSPPAGVDFVDLSPSHWAYRDIGAAKQAGWINGYPDNTFRPDSAVTRAELAQILVDVFKLEMPAAAEDDEAATAEVAETAEQQQPAFLDLGQPGYAWADGAVTVLAALGVATGNGDGNYQPRRSVTRAEFAVFLDRIMTLTEQE